MEYENNMRTSISFAKCFSKYIKTGILFQIEFENCFDLFKEKRA